MPIIRGRDRWVVDNARSGPSDEESLLDKLIQPLKRMEESLQGRLDAIQQAAESLRENEARCRTLVENSPDGIVIIAEGKILFVNAAFLTLHGLTDAAQALGPVDQFVLAEDRERVMEWIFARQRGESVSSTYEYRIRRPDGEIRTLQTVLTTTTYKAQPAVMGVIRDITDIRMMETALHASKELLGGILETAAEAIVSIDEAQHITMFNQGAGRIFGYSAQEVIGRPLDLLLPERFREVHRQRVRNFAAAPEKARRIAEGFQVFGRRKDGSEFPAEASISKLTVRNGTIFTVIFWDITERKKAEEELKQSREQLRSLAARLQQVREEERASLARAIHDELSGALTALKMELSLVPSRVTQELQQLLTQNTSSISEHIVSTLERVRTIASELRPAVLDHLGLIAAIEWESQQFQHRSGVQCETSLPEQEIPLDRERSTAVFRILQEALTNIALHAHASKVTVNVKREDGSLILEVKDNGKGIQQSEIFHVKSLGLLGMRERALAFGGEVQISGAPGQGTLVRLRMPERLENISID